MVIHCHEPLPRVAVPRVRCLLGDDSDYASPGQEARVKVGNAASALRGLLKARATPSL